MYFVLALALLAPFLTRAQELTIYNFCDPVVFVWEVGENTTALQPMRTTDFTRTTLESDPVTSGKDIVLSFDVDGIRNGTPTLHFNYNAIGGGDGSGELYYQLSNGNGIMLKDHTLQLTGTAWGVVNPSGQCPEVAWRDGQGDSDIKYCKGYMWMELRLCMDLMGP